MSKQPNRTIKLNDVLILYEYMDGSRKHFRLWDDMRKMHLDMQATNLIEVIIEALCYYQKQLTDIEQKLDKKIR